MKGLLHSKRFKANLRKWLFMYVGVMGLLTTVITYSKYIANFGTNTDSARVAKFNVYATYLNCKESETMDACITRVITEGQSESSTTTAKTYSASRLTSVFPVYFYVDYREIETGANLTLTFINDNRFSIKGITEYSSENPAGISLGVPSKNENNPITGLEGNNVLSINKANINSSVGKSIYKVDLQYNCSNSSVCELNKDTIDGFTSVEDIVKVGYSAIQNK